MASDYLLEIDGIKGESADSKHKGAIEIESFSWGVSNSGSAAGGGGGGGGAGKASFQDLHFTTSVSKASPLLFLACAKGSHIKEATLTVRKAGREQQDFYMITLSDILISSYQQSGNATGDNSLPMDQISMNYAKIEIEYRPQNADGALGEPVKASWDIKKATGG